MERFDAALVGLVRDLKTAGITRAGTDPTTLTAPCVWISPKTLTPEHLDGSLAMSVHVAMIAPDHRQAQAITELAGLLETVLGVLDDTPETIEAATISLPSSGQTNLPALLTETTLTVKGH